MVALKRARSGAGFGYRKSGYGAARRSSNVKYVDLAAANYGCNTTGSVTLIPVIATGPDETNRIGRNVELKSLQVRGRVFNNATATMNQCVVAVVYDRQPNKVLAGITDIYDSISPQAFRKDENKDRFLVLKEWRFILTAAPGANVQADTKTINKYMKLKGLPVNYSNVGTGAIGDINTGALLLVTMGNVASGTADATFTAACRTRFTDV